MTSSGSPPTSRLVRGEFKGVSLSLLALWACGSDSRSELVIPAVLEVSGAPFECGRAYPAGEPTRQISLVDARLYLQGLQVRGGDGSWLPIALTPGPFQGDGVVLLDFEAACDVGGSSQTHTAITGSVAAPWTTGLALTLGLSPEKNHLDVTDAPPPLDDTSLFWVWQLGRKYLKLDGHSRSEGGEAIAFVLHWGAARCAGESPLAAPPLGCQEPNLVTVVLDDFEPGQDTLVIDLGGLLEGVDLADPVFFSGEGCASVGDVPACQRLARNLGLVAGVPGRCFSGR